jgi:hypothetical protein
MIAYHTRCAVVTKESMKANRKSSNKESNIPIVEAPEVKQAPLGANEFGTPILPILTHTIEPAPATEPATVTVETTVPVIEKKAKKAKAVKPAPVAQVSKLRVTDDELQVLIKEQHAKHEVPKSFRALNQERLQAVLGETKVSELEHNAATRDAKFLSGWMKWCLGEYKNLAK